MYLIEADQYIEIHLTLPSICYLSSTLQIKWGGFFSPILSIWIPRWLLLLALKSYLIIIKTHYPWWKELLVASHNRGYTEWQMFFKSKFVALTSRADRTQAELGNRELSFDPVSDEAITEVPRRDDCEMKHEAKLPLFGCYALDPLLPHTKVSWLHVETHQICSSMNTQAEPRTEDTTAG